MPRPTSIDRLPEAVKGKIGQLRAAGRTIDEILAALATLDGKAPVSRSALGRHVKGLDVIAERLRRSRAVAEALVAKFGDAGEPKQLRLNVELMHGVVTDLVSGAEEGGPVTLDPEKTMFLARAVKDLGSAAKSGVETIERSDKIRRAAKAEAMKEAASAAAAEAKARGLSPEVVKAIEARILGVGS